MRPFAAALTDAGIATWNVEYRRLGNAGGGWPGTFHDVGQAADFLKTFADKNQLDLKRVIAIGHSAGGPLAMWLAARPKLPKTSDLYLGNSLSLSGVINLDGPCDLNAFLSRQAMCESPVITNLMGGSPVEQPQRYRDASPMELLPLGVRQEVFAGQLFAEEVPAYEQAAKAAGDTLRTTVLADPNHFVFIDPQSEVFPQVLAAVRRLGPEVDAFKKAQDALLAKYRVKAKSRYLKLKKPQTTVHVLEAGQGKPLLLIHGGRSCACSFAPLIAALGSDFHVYAIDRPGHGLSDEFNYQNTALREHAVEVISSVMDELKLSDANVVGNSMGGLWALQFALAKPDRVTKLVLLGEPAGSNAVPTNSPPPSSKDPVIQAVQGAFAERLVADIKRVPEELLQAELANQRLPWFAVSWNTLLEKVKNDRQGTYQLRPKLKNLQPATLFIWGDQDKLGPPTLGIEMAKLAPNARCEVLPDAGHLPWLDQPVICRRLITEFLAGQPEDLAVRRKRINDSCLTTKGARDDVANVDNQTVPAEGRQIPVRVYKPKGDGPFPLLVYMHGGGFFAGNLETHDNACRYLCNRTPCCIVAVDYRLASQHKFPAGLEDCYEATNWTAMNAAKLGGDSGKIAVIGDSAGGNLAAAVCLMARDRRIPTILCQVLVNPALDLNLVAARTIDDYLKESKDATNPYASPLLADNLKGLPPAFIVTGEIDPLRNDGEDYAAKLRQDGATVNVYRQQGMDHLGPRWAAAAPVAEEALDLSIGVLRAAFRNGK
jgi:acetyl esterase